MLDREIRASILRTYAAHAGHKYAPAICRWARIELARMAPEPAPEPERERVRRDLFD